LGALPLAAADHDPLGLLEHECQPGVKECAPARDSSPDLVDPAAPQSLPPAPAAPSFLARVGSLAGDAGAAIGGAAVATVAAIGGAFDALGAALGALSSAFVGRVAIVGAALLGLVAAVGLAFQSAFDAVAAIGGAFAALALAIAAALHAYASFLLGLKPAAMPVAAWAAVSAGSTAVAAGAAQGGLWWALRRWGYLLALVPGFSRIAKSDLLEHDTRSHIYEMIRQNPGIRKVDVAKRLDLPWGTCVHHLRKLLADRLIAERHIGRHVSFFINGSGLSQDQMRAAAVVQGGTVQAVATFIEQNPQANLKQVAEGVGISAPLANFHVEKLVTAGLVHKVRDGRHIRLVSAAMPTAPSMVDGVPGPVAA